MADTKMRPIRQTIPLEQALTLAEGAAVPLDRTERIDLDVSVGRVLAAGVVADRDVPPFDRGAMDGYAVRGADTAAAPVSLRLIARLG